MSKQRRIADRAFVRAAFRTPAFWAYATQAIGLLLVGGSILHKGFIPDTHALEGLLRSPLALAGVILIGVGWIPVRVFVTWSKGELKFKKRLEE